MIELAGVAGHVGVSVVRETLVREAEAYLSSNKRAVAHIRRPTLVAA